MTTTGYINLALEVFGGILSLVVLLFSAMSETRGTRTARLFIAMLGCNALLLFSDAAAFGFKGGEGALSYYGVRVANFLVYCLGYVLLALFTAYLVAHIRTKTAVSHRPVYLMAGMCALAFLLVVVSQFNHMFYTFEEPNMYKRQDWFWLSQVWGIAGMLVNLWLIVRYSRHFTGRERIALLSYIALPVLAMLIQIRVYGLALLNMATTLALLTIYAGIQVDQSRRLKAQELELSESRIAVTMSQIQPHFLYNALSAIASLCDSDPARAKRATINFSVYLRGNLDALTQKEPVPFSQELRHVETYMKLEKMRFGDELEIVYDIRETDFRLPALTVQPLMENAVKHGVGKKPAGGTVTLSTRETDKAFVVTIADDGVGFEPGARTADGRSHVGIDNARQRLHALCGGTLTVDSAPGKGTTAVIAVPKRMG